MSGGWLRPRSLRGQLLVWLVLLHLTATAAAAAFVYVRYGRIAHAFMDDQMQVLADSYAANEVGTPPVVRPVSEKNVHVHGSFIVQVFGVDGRLVAGSLPTLAVPLQPGPGYRDVHTGPDATDAWRVYTAAPDVRGNSAPRIQVLQSDSFRRLQVRRRALSDAAPTALLLPPLLVVLWLIVSAASRSLRAVAREVSLQDETRLSDLSLARVPDEIAPLVVAFNSLLGRLRQAFGEQRRFVQDAAHELRTPIAAIGLQIENLRALVPSGEAAERFAQLEAGVTRAGHLIEQLLSLSRREAPLPLVAPEPTDVGALLRESVGQSMPLADRRAIDIGFEGSVQACVAAPVAELRSVFDNLIDNALRHTPEGGVVDVRLHALAAGTVVDVADNGPGIDPQWAERVFDRFFRVPGTPAGGSGLGLAIARAAAERWGLRIELRNRERAEGGPGLLVRVHLPA